MIHKASSEGEHRLTATLFFDLDGTLCHPRVPFTQIFFASCAPLLDGLDSVDEALASSLLSTWTVVLELPGPSTTAGCLARALSAMGISASEQLVSQCARSLVDDWAAMQQLDASAAETLTLLARRHPLGIITNGPSDAQRAVIRALHLDDVFGWCIVSGDTDLGIRKPDPRIFQHALAASGSRLEDTWYIGDSPVNDIAGAASAGWRTCWISAPGQPFPADVPPPDVRITRLDELPHILGHYE